jgi:hypothetical protein
VEYANRNAKRRREPLPPLPPLFPARGVRVAFWDDELSAWFRLTVPPHD